MTVHAALVNAASVYLLVCWAIGVAYTTGKIFNFVWWLGEVIAAGIKTKRMRQRENGAP